MPDITGKKYHLLKKKLLKLIGNSWPDPLGIGLFFCLELEAKD